MAGIYLHIPFCKQACHYCDFHFSTNQEFRPQMVHALAQELELRKGYVQNEAVKTIYFGGGTPSLLSSSELALLIDTIQKNFLLASEVEITLEANPDDCDRPKLKELKSLGINRLSIGIQSFNNEQLTFINRAHSGETAQSCLNNARETGFDNISLDLIYAIPGETEQILKSDLEKTLAFKPEHISCYSLTIEPKTVFGSWTKTGKLKPNDDEVAAKHLEIVMQALGDAGYEHYEVSNFALPGYYSKHNSSYWSGEKYLGIGPSAHSYDLVSRQYSVSNNHDYLRKIAEGKIFYEREILTKADKVNEYLLTTLRTQWGCDLQFLKKNLDYSITDEQQVYIKQLEENGFAIITNSKVVLTRKGRMMADKIASDLFIEI